MPGLSGLLSPPDGLSSCLTDGGLPHSVPQAGVLLQRVLVLVGPHPPSPQPAEQPGVEEGLGLHDVEVTSRLRVSRSGAEERPALPTPRRRILPVDYNEAPASQITLTICSTLKALHKKRN